MATVAGAFPATRSLLICLAVLQGVPLAHAQVANDWKGGNGNWNVANNWGLGMVPGPSNIATILNASLVTIDSSVFSPLGIIVSSAKGPGAATLQVVGGGNVNVTGQSFLGTGGFDTIGTISVNGAGSTFGSAVLVLGENSSAGLLQVQNGGVVNVNNIVTRHVGNSRFLVDGAGSQLNAVDIAIAGDVNVIVQNGGIANLGVVQFTPNVSSFILNIGTGGQSGTVTTSTGSIVNQSGPMVVFFNHTDVTTFTLSLIQAGGTTSLTKSGSGTTILTGDSLYSGGTNIQAGTLQLGNGGTSGSIIGSVANEGVFAINRSDIFTFGGAISGGGALAQIGSGTTVLTGANGYAGGTNIQSGTLQLGNGGTSGSIIGNVVNNGTFAINRSDTFTFGGVISGGGVLAQIGTGTTVLTGANTYAGGTFLNAGTLSVAQDANLGAASGSLTFSGGTLQNTAAFATNRGIVLNPAGGTFQTAANLSVGGVISGSGALTKTGPGVLNLAGVNTYAGPTSVLAGALAVNGSITSNVTVGGSGVIAGSGTIFGNVVNGGVAAPGNSIGTLTVAGNFTQNGGAYQAEVNGAGQADRLNVGGTATLNGGAVRVVALPGTYRRNTTYTIVTAGVGVTGTYAGVTGNSAFLVPTLSYDANDVYLTLTVPQNAFYLAGFTPNQRAVGAVIDATFDTASGDYATVIGALTGLSAFQAPAALDAMSGQQYADFGTVNVNNSALFMNVLGQQMAAARGTTGGAQRRALAQACETAACEGTGPWTAWASALGGFGSVAGDYNASTVTYSLGGGAVGIDYRVDPRFLVGIGTAYTAGNMWVNNFLGRGTTDSVAVAAYGSFTQGGFYADLLGGYAYFNNQQQRQILVPGLQPRTASGSTGANQVLGQIETGYRFGIFAPAAATLTPFARLQGSSVTQNAFAEWGAQSLSLNVSQQTTNSLRSTFGDNLAGAIAIGDTRTLDLDLRLGWQHEYANTGRSITAALSGAPFAAFTVYGATPQRDAAVVGFSARTEVADNTQLYLR